MAVIHVMYIYTFHMMPLLVPAVIREAICLHCKGWTERDSDVLLWLTQPSEQVKGRAHQCWMAPTPARSLVLFYGSPQSPRVWPRGEELEASRESLREVGIAFCWFRATREQLWLVMGVKALPWTDCRNTAAEQSFSGFHWSCQRYAPVSEITHVFPCLARAELAHLGPTFTPALEHLCH